MDIPSEAKIKQTLTPKKVKERQINMNNKWEHYYTSVQHEIQLLQSFKSLQDNSKSNYWKNNTLPKIINMVLVSPRALTQHKERGFREQIC